MVPRATSSSAKACSARPSEAGSGRSPRALEEETPPFRFSRMGPTGDEQAARRAEREEGRPGDGGAAGAAPSRMPAGFTYLGQFVDHDLTFDKTERHARRERLAGAAPAGALAEPRPRLALRRRAERSGLGEVLRGRRPPPEDGQDDRGRRHPGEGGLRPSSCGAGSNDAEKRKAIIPDPRNDENLAVAQTHLAFIRFHNRVVDTLPASVPPGAALREARGGRSPSTTSGCSAPTTCRGSARPAS